GGAGCAFGDRSRVGPAVEDDQGAVVEAESVQVAVQLGQAAGQWVGLAGSPYLEFDGLALPVSFSGRVGPRPADEYVDAAPADAVFAVDVAAAVDDALQEAHQDELGCGFVVVLGVGEDFAVFAPEVGELVQQQGEVEAAVGEYEGAGVGEHVDFDAGGQDSGDDFAVDRVGDPGWVAWCDQAEVADVGEVVVVGVEGEQGPGEDGSEDTADAGFGEFRGRGVEVGGAVQDESFLGLFQVLGGDRFRGGDSDLLDDLPGQCVDQSGLSGGQLDRPLHRVRGELLAGLGSVLGVELAHFVGGEVAQPQRLHLDVEGAGGAEPVGVTTAGSLVVAHIPQPAQCHRGGKPVRSFVISVP